VYLCPTCEMSDVVYPTYLSLTVLRNHLSEIISRLNYKIDGGGKITSLKI